MSESAPSDVGSIDAVIAGLYDVISGPAGQARSWDRLRALLHPHGRLLRMNLLPEARVEVVAMNIEEFIVMADPFLATRGFHERELARRVEQFGHIAHVFSTYEASGDPDGGNPLGRGINSIQLWHDGQRWWVMSLLWDDERPGSPIPARYLA
jgi:hypothetical protein